MMCWAGIGVSLNRTTNPGTIASRAKIVNPWGGYPSTVDWDDWPMEGENDFICPGWGPVFSFCTGSAHCVTSPACRCYTHTLTEESQGEEGREDRMKMEKDSFCKDRAPHKKSQA